MTNLFLSFLSFPANVTHTIMEYSAKEDFLPTKGKRKIDHDDTEKFTKMATDEIYDFFAKQVIQTAVSSVIFLDIDGVVYKEPRGNELYDMRMKLFPTSTACTEDVSDIAATHLFHPHAMFNLKKIFSNKNSAVVLTSRWGDFQTVLKLRWIFAVCFFSPYILDKTPDSSDKDYQYKRRPLLKKEGFFERAAKIEDWLRRHPTIKNYVIIDDMDEGLSSKYPQRFVKIDGEKLLNDADADKAKKILEDDLS